MADGEVDAIAFTSKLQIERLVTQQPAPLVRRALSRTKIAAVGPIVAEAIRAAGFEVASSPEHSWFMKPLVVALSEQLGARKTRTSPASPNGDIPDLLADRGRASPLDLVQIK